MTAELYVLFRGDPILLNLYAAIERRILTRWDDVRVTVHKTQVSFSARYGFAFVSPPYRRMKGWPERCVILSFGLDAHIVSPRIVQTAHPRANRWTHHVLIANESELDEEVMGWLELAYAFGNR